MHSSGGGATSSVPASKATRLQHLADRLVGGDAAGGDQRGRRAVFACGRCASPRAAGRARRRRPPAGTRRTDRRRRWSDSGAIFSASSRSAVFRPDSEKSASGRPLHRPRQREALRIAVRGVASRPRAAGIAKAEQLRGLVEGLADRVVDRGAEPHIIADAAHRDDLGVAAGGEKQAIGKRDVVGQPRGQRMRFEMVDRDQRLVVRPARSPWRWSARRSRRRSGPARPPRRRRRARR